uniref:Heat shock cognate 70 kDa protein-like n=1 Tax=Tanacetum cinerariifolium TaxID=118510 RepID=A0A699I736_TANCI|nr:heat shock cognate 70 kDa protein-like [Tanacetum cinerariifolium]
MGSRVQKDIELWPFKITEGSEEKPMFVVERKSGLKREFSCEEVYSMILKNIKEAAEAYLGTMVTHAVITVPQHFSDTQQQITKDASKLVGLNVMRVITEPRSAQVSYVLDKSLDLYSPIDKTVFVFDMSGKTFTVSLLRINKAGTINSVENAAGDTHLSGEDFDKFMVNHCVQEFKKKENKDVTENEKARIRLNVACEEAKRDLSSTTQTSIEIDSLIDEIDFSIKFSKENFEELKVRFLNECIEHVKNCLKDHKMHKTDVDDVVIVGGSKQNISMVQQMLMKFFDGKPILKSVNVDEAVAHGAALLAAR